MDSVSGTVPPGEVVEVLQVQMICGPGTRRDKSRFTGKALIKIRQVGSSNPRLRIPQGLKDSSEESLTQFRMVVAEGLSVQGDDHIALVVAHPAAKCVDQLSHKVVTASPLTGVLGELIGPMVASE